MNIEEQARQQENNGFQVSEYSLTEKKIVNIYGKIAGKIYSLDLFINSDNILITDKYWDCDSIKINKKELQNYKYGAFLYLCKAFPENAKHKFNITKLLCKYLIDEKIISEDSNEK